MFTTLNIHHPAWNQKHYFLWFMEQDSGRFLLISQDPKMKDNKRRKYLNAKSFGEVAWLIKLLTPRKENLKAYHELTETYVWHI